MERQAAQRPSAGQAGMSPMIHLVYRRGDVDDTAGRIYDRLVARYGPSAVARDLFRQADELPPEPAARAFLQAQMERMAVQIIVIGPRWLDGLARERDIARVEVAAALARQLSIIPVLAEGASMPTGAQLPAELAPLALFNAALARLDPDFDADMGRLLPTIERYAPALPARPPASPSPASAPARPARRPPRLFRSPLRIASAASVSAALVFLLIAIIVSQAARSGSPPTALAATPAPTATFLPTPSSPGSYFSPLTDGMPDWLLLSDQCQPRPDGLHIVNSSSGCQAPHEADAGDGDLSVAARQISGSPTAPYGLQFRIGLFGGKFYGFYITSNGEWSVIKRIYKSSAFVSAWSATPAIHTGLDAANTLEVRFKGSRLTFLINGQQVGSVTDSSLPAQGTASDPGSNVGDGLVGSGGATIVFTNYTLKPLP
ncbi:MAG TPA: hypothetical protein VFQ25_07065 [Ktedonobacterales bacterium]|nr:hypothetical protein [Ktedonobacterales bacterium]